MSVRSSRPKIAAGKSTEPASVPSSVRILSSISGALLCVRRCLLGSLFLIRRGRCLRHAEFTRLGSALRQFLFHGFAQYYPAAFVAGYGALDQNEAALHIGLHNPKIECRHALRSQVTGHFFVLEGFTGILTPASRAMRPVRYGNAMGSAQAREIPTLHRAGETLSN